MGEFWDIYDENRKKTGRFAERDVYKLKKGEYHIVVTAIIINSKNEILITKRAPQKSFALMWELTGGSVKKGETSLEGIIREVNEEIGINFSKKEAIYLKTVRETKLCNDFKDMWVFKKDIKLEDLVLQKEEVIDAKWVDINKFLEGKNDKSIIPIIDFDENDYKKVIDLKQRESYKYIGENVSVKIDRPKGSKHPKHDFEYEVNYGYVPNTISGDDEEIDCYILGENEKLKEFKGKCIAVIHRTNDDDDKLVIVPEGKDFTDEKIKELTNFQEKYFESEIIR